MGSKICKLESKRAQMKLLQKERQPLTFTHPRQLSLVQFTEQMEGGKPYMQSNGILMFQYKMHRGECCMHGTSLHTGTHNPAQQ